MGKIKFYVAASLDGFLSDEQGGVDWLMPFQNTPYDYGYADFYSTIGYIVTGSKTYEQAREFPGGWQSAHATTYVFTSRDLETDGRDDIVLWRGGVKELTDQLRKEKRDSWLMGGANLASQFFNEKCVDELILATIPVVLGKGQPLFEGTSGPLDMKLEWVKDFPNGVIQMKYIPT